ncbi:hypothetical protein C8R31_102502 [Nitrosospira sp. Nsp2]|uniref:hypothetical protein n=1 Tax=Nitrosospira sp. Nsp2 TaxID=136548 RepID=UPI000D4136B3|nr:hypothetical protein [Nitrosospira sp. Nsp2]PTR16487.1 hypothetical protein C8R31_102502 [Nitrosospira sp. Nsp2]
MIKNVPFVAEEYIERDVAASTDFIQGVAKRRLPTPLSSNSRASAYLTVRPNR